MMRLQNLFRFQSAWTAAPGREHPVFLTSRVRLARNLARYPFPAAAGSKALAAVRREVFSVVRAHGSLANPAFLELETLEPVDLHLLVERHLVSHDMLERPEGRGLAVGAGERTSVMVNEEDHLRLQAIGPGLCLEEVHAGVDRLEAALSGAGFAFHKRWGYLASCPTNTGTGLRASVLAHLGAAVLLGRTGALFKAAAQRGLLVRGLHGEGTQVQGDLFQVSTGTAMGRSESEYIAGLGRFVRGLEEVERRCREVLLTPARRVQFEDQAFRAFGLLTHARRLSFEEMMHWLSLLRLGVLAGLPLRVKPARLQELILNARPSHLRYALARELSPEEEPAARADYVRRALGS